MKHLFTALILMCIITPTELEQYSSNKTDQLTELLSLIQKPTADTQKRGCCSWHGGVCGCSNGRAICCDGQTSPSCGC